MDEQGIVLINGYPVNETSLAPIKAKDIVDCECRKEITSTKFYSHWSEFRQVISLILEMVSGFGSFILALLLHFCYTDNDPANDYLVGYFVALLIACLFSITLPYGAPYLKYRLQKRKKLNEPLIKLEKKLADRVEAFNQRVETINLLEGNNEITPEQKEEISQKLEVIKENIEQQIEKFRERKKLKKLTESLEKLPGASDSLFKELPANTLEIDVLLEGGIIAKNESLTEAEEEMNNELMLLPDEIKP